MTIPALLTEAEAAEVLKLCPKTLRKDRKAGRLTFRLFGSAIRYTMDDLTAYIEKARQCPSTDAKARRTGGSRSRSTVCDFEEARAAKASARLPR